MFGSLNSALNMRKDYQGTYVLGKVVLNIDPNKKDLIQAEAPGLYDPGLGELPWLGVLKQSPFGIGKNWGVYGSPAPGSDLAIELQEGNGSYGLYHSIQRYAAPPEFSKSGKVWGFKDPKGNWFRCDLETGEVVFNASAGVTFVVHPDGRLQVTGAGEGTLTFPKLTINADIDHYGTLYSNGKNVGSDHAHDGVEKGGATTGGPI